MNVILLIAGIVLVAVAVLDALWTTFWTDGVAGPISSRMARLLWRGWRVAVPVNAHRTLTIAGPFILFSIVIMWALMIWLGWSLIFAADVTSLKDPSSGQHPDFIGRLYFAAMAVFTMGNGDFAPQGSGWQIATALANANGFFVLTLVLSYVLSVLSAEIEKRALAQSVFGMGSTGTDFVLAGWDGKDFKSLDIALNSISTRLGQLTEQHLAYPVLHYFLPVQQKSSPLVAAAILEDALMFLRHGVQEECRPNGVYLKALQSSLNGFAENLKAVPSSANESDAPGLSVDALKKANVPVASEEELRKAIAGRGKERRLLAGHLKDNRWQWPD